MSALTSLLVRDQVVPVRKIEEALQRQVVSGGEIETVLLEMAALPENVLAGYAAATIGLRAATADEVMRAPREVVRIVPREVAEKHRLVPVAVEGRILYVAVIEALSAEVDQQLGFLLGFDLVPRVVTEVRLAAALAQHYGVEPLPRLARLAEKLKERDPGEVPYVAPLASRPAEQYLPSERRRVGFGAFDDEDEDEASDSSQATPAATRPAVKWSTPTATPDAERVSLAGAAPFGESVERATRPFGFAVQADRNTVPDRPRPSTWTGPAAAPAVPAEPPPSVPPEAAPADVIDRSADTTDRAAVAPPEPPASIPAPTQAAAKMPSLSEPPRTPSWRPSPSARPEAAGVKTLLVALGAKGDRAQALPAPLSAPPPTATAAERRASGFYARLRGPLGERAVAELLGEAETRDEVLATFFAFARQSFDYTALFVVQDDVAEGRESSGPGATTEELERIAVSLEAGGLYANVRHDGVGRVATLDGSERDRALATRLKRPPATPCAVLPLTIRRRVVLMLHGDRGGESFTLEELPELLGMMPRVSEAFERLILRRKFVHTDAGTRTAPDTDRAPPRTSEPAPPRTSEPAPPRASERAPSTVRSTPAAEPPPETIEAPIVAARTKRAMSSSLSVLGVPRSAPPPPMPKRPGALTPAPFAVPKAAPVPVLAESVIAPLATLPEPADEPEPVLLTARRPSTPAQAAAVGVPIADDDEDVIVEMSSSPSGDDDDDDLDEGDDEPDAPSTDTAPASARPRVDGSYSVRGAAEEVVAARPRRTSSPPGRSAPSSPPAARSTSRVTPTASPTSSARLSKDTRPETPFSRERQNNTASQNEPSVIVDMGDNVEGTIEELMSTAPDGESSIMPRLMRLGDAALPALVQHFPGPLWFDRRTPHARLPRGRDVSAIARALAAYRERAAPYVASLLDNKDADTRFYATLLASEIVHGALLDALGQRVFDEDAGTRLLALDVLKRYQHLPEYASVLEAIRATARILHRDTGRRRTALRAIAELRDARAVPMLITVLDDEDEGVRGEAHRTLVALTKQDFGDQRKRWELWAEKNVQRHRIEWLIEGLLHNDEPLRAAAGEELKRLTQEYYGYHPGSPRRERERVHGKYLQWWASEGKSKF